MSSNHLQSIDLAAAMGSNLAPAGQPPEAQSRNYDSNRVARAEQQPDGSFVYRVEGALRGNYADAVKSKSDPWEYAMHPQHRTRLAAHEVTGDSIIRIRGAEMTVDQAIMMEYLPPRLVAGGPYVAATPQGTATEAQEQQAEQEPLHPDLQTEAVDMPTERTFTALVENTSAGTQIAAVNDLATEGEISERHVAELASQMMVEPGQVNQMIESMRPAFQAQADKVATEQGVDAEMVWEWANDAMPREVQKAIDRHLTLRNTHGYREIVKTYVSNLDSINPDMILNAQVEGAKVSRAPNGKIVLTTPDGKTWTWSEALALGMKLSRPK